MCRKFQKVSKNPPTLPSLGRGRAAPGTTAGVELCIRTSTKHRSRPAMPPHGPATPRTATVGFRKRRMAPRPSKASPHLSRPSLRPAMAPPWPAKPWTAVLWLPKATDGTSAFKSLAAPQPSSSNGASVASQALDSSSMASESDGWHLGLQNPRAPQPAHSSSSNGASVASQALDSSCMASKSLAAPQPAQSSSSNGASVASRWYLGLQNPRRASAGPVFVQQWRLRGQPSPGQQFYGFRKRRMAPRPSKASPRLSRPSLRPAMAPPWPARPWTAVLWLAKATDGTSAFKTLAAPQPAQSSFNNGASVASQAQDSNSWLPKATDGTSAFKSLAAPQPAQSSSSNGASVGSQALDSSSMASESDGWHLGLQKPRRASAGPVFVQPWRLRGQPGSGQQFYGFRKRRMAPRPSKPSPRLSRPSLRPAMAPPWPAKPWTALYMASESDGWHLGLQKPRRASAAQSSSSNGASVASQALNSSSMASESDGWHLGLQKPRSSSNGASVASQALDSSSIASESDGWYLGLQNPRRASAGPVFVQQWRLRGQPSPGQQFYGFRKRRMVQKPRRASAGPVFVQKWRLRGQPGPGQQFYGVRKRRMAPRPSKASPRVSRPSLRPAMAPPWPAKPWTAVLWLPKATDGTSAFKSLAAPQPAQSSSSNGASVASQALDSSSMASESDGWHLGLQKPRRASAGPQSSSAPPSPSKPRTAVLWLPKATDGTSKPSPRPTATARSSALKTLAAPQPAQSSSSNGASVADQAQVIWLLKATDGTSALLTLAAPEATDATSASVASHAHDSISMASENAGWHLGLENPRRACTRQWRQSLA